MLKKFPLISHYLSIERKIKRRLIIELSLLNRKLNMFSNYLINKIHSVNNLYRNYKSQNNEGIEAIVIAASTGGPKALEKLISGLNKDINIPIFIVQHMTKEFTKYFAERLDKKTSLKVVEAYNGQKIEKNVIYIAPGDYHMIVEKGYIRTNKREKIHGLRPAADYLFSSAAKEYKSHLIGIILTGMGKDGVIGMENIKREHGYNIAQSRKTCAIYGMPYNAVKHGVIDKVLDIEDIAEFINTKVKGL